MTYLAVGPTTQVSLPSGNNTEISRSSKRISSSEVSVSDGLVLSSFASSFHLKDPFSITSPKVGVVSSSIGLDLRADTCSETSSSPRNVESRERATPPCQQGGDRYVTPKQTLTWIIELIAYGTELNGTLDLDQLCIKGSELRCIRQHVENCQSLEHRSSFKDKDIKQSSYGP